MSKTERQAVHSACHVLAVILLPLVTRPEALRRPAAHKLWSEQHFKDVSTLDSPSRLKIWPSDLWAPE